MHTFKRCCLTLIFLFCLGCDRTPPAPVPVWPEAITVITLNDGHVQEPREFPVEHPLTVAAHYWLDMANTSDDWRRNDVSYAPVRLIRFGDSSVNFMGDHVILNRKLQDGSNEQVSRRMTRQDRQLLKLLEDTLNEPTTQPARQDRPAQPNELVEHGQPE